ncbi:hypothetical protein GCM10010276_50690 [Streptomyces longisporus]|uniref:Uncharacterized protein n=1 Tax=Streptomyces longisporus TaxID=1948 RepID=A0ABP5ZNT0_STRLO
MEVGEREVVDPRAPVGARSPVPPGVYGSQHRTGTGQMPDDPGDGGGTSAAVQDKDRTAGAVI